MRDQAASFPPQIKYIIGNEACERFSYYGMRSILVVFMAKHLKMAGNDAEAVFHVFVGGGYLLTLLGGYLSDRVLGKYRTILYLSLFYCAGHATLALWDSKAGLYCGLALIALGMGGVKSTVSAYVGDQFTQSNKHLVDKVFNLFYWSINVGAFTSSLAIPWVLERFGPYWAFGIPGILMGLATLIFWLGRRSYVHVPPSPKAEEGGGSIGWGVIKVFLAVSVFWALFDQQGSSWVLQGERMKLDVLGMKVSSSQMQALNPIMVLILIPIFTLYLYPAFERHGVKMTALRKIGAGMFLTSLCFLSLGVFEILLNSGVRLSIAWQFIPYLIISMGEVLVSIPGLEFAYSQAPRSMKSTLMSFWFLTFFAGNFLTAFVAKINVFSGPGFFLFFAGLMVGVSAVFAVIASRYQLREYYEKAG